MILDECVRKERINGPINSLHREEDESRQIGVYEYINSPLTHTTKDQADKSIMVCVYALCITLIVEWNTVIIFFPYMCRRREEKT
jgi:hypothetical protein